LQGIDAPEKDQAYGQKSKQSLSQLVFGRDVTVDFTKKDKYGRTVGKVFLNKQDMCLEQVKRGLAWHYKQYQVEQSNDDQNLYAQADLTAKNQLAGLWKDKNPTPPWEYRKK
jgi:endonuclease YncB( thermonuclease family)